MKSTGVVVESDRWVDHTREVVIELERAISTLKDAETGNGSSRVADEAIDRADFAKRADENVLVQARGTQRPELAPAVHDVVAGPEHAARDLRPPSGCAPAIPR